MTEYFQKEIIDLIEKMNESYSLASLLYRRGNPQEALTAILPAKEITDFFLEKIQNRKFLKKEAELDKKCGFLGALYGELGDDETSMYYYKAYQFLKMQLAPNFDTSKPLTMYQFRRFSDYALSNLINREITLSHPSVMNDMVDTLVFAWLESGAYCRNNLHTRHCNNLKESYNDYRIASFCTDNEEKNQYAIQNTLMWAHYTEDHSGFCVEYEMSPDEFVQNNMQERTASRFFKIQYVNHQKETINFENSNEVISSQIAFLKKSGEWEYENEVRLIQYKPVDGALRQQYKLSPRTKISRIYLGCRCSDSRISIIRELMKNQNVELFKMRIDYSDVYHLKKVPI